MLSCASPGHPQSASQSIPKFLGDRLKTRVHFFLIQSPLKRVVSNIVEPVAEVGDPIEEDCGRGWVYFRPKIDE
jgi:hypothetical protein